MGSLTYPIVLPIPSAGHSVRLKPLPPYLRRVLRKHLLEHTRDASVRRGPAHCLPRPFVRELRPPERHGQGVPLLLCLDRNLDLT
jgi:hypothetical protein